MNFKICIECHEPGHEYQDCPKRKNLHQPLQTGTNTPTTSTIPNSDLITLYDTSISSTVSTIAPLLKNINNATAAIFTNKFWIETELKNLLIGLIHISSNAANCRSHSLHNNGIPTATKNVPNSPQNPSDIITADNEEKNENSKNDDPRINTLREYGNNWKNGNNKNIKKIGRRLIGFINAYSDCNDELIGFINAYPDCDHEVKHISVAGSARKVCETICNYILKNKSQGKMKTPLAGLTNKVSEIILYYQFQYPFPRDEMHKICEKAGGMLYDEGYNQEVELVVSYDALKEIFESMYNIVVWFNTFSPFIPLCHIVYPDKFKYCV